MKLTKLIMHPDRIIARFESELEFAIPELVEVERQEMLRELRMRVQDAVKERSSYE